MLLLVGSAVVFPVYVSVNTPLSQNNSFNLSIHFTDVLSNPALNVNADDVSNPTALVGKTPTVVVLAINPPLVPKNVGLVVAGFSISCEIARVCYANWILFYIGSHSGSYRLTLLIIALLMFIFLFTLLV